MEGEAVPAAGEPQQLTRCDANGKFGCNLCEARGIATRQGITRHLVAHHKDEDLNDAYYRQCQGCRKAFAGEDGLRRHHGNSPQCQQPANGNGNGNNNIAPNINQHVERDDDDSDSLDSAVARAAQERTEMISALLADDSKQRLLLGKLKEGMYNVNFNWKGPFRSIEIKLLAGMVSADDQITLANTLAHEILPGLIRYTSRHSRAGKRPIDLWRQIDGSDNAAEELLIEGLRALRAIESSGEEDPPMQGAVTGLLKATETMGARARLSAADRFLRQADAALTSELPPEANQQPLPATEHYTPAYQVKTRQDGMLMTGDV
jgi:hypothetical protein